MSAQETMTAKGEQSAGNLPALKGRVLFALTESGHPTNSLLTAVRFCEGFRADLHVLRVFDGSWGPESSGPEGLTSLGSRLSVDRTLSVLRSTRLWLDCNSVDQIASRTVGVCGGDFFEVVGAHATEMGAELIVLPPLEGQGGTAVAALARDTRVPVVVARESSAGGTIVVASDLEDPEYPVLHFAELVGVCLASPVVAVHNVRPFVGYLGPRRVGPPVIPLEVSVRLAEMKLSQAVDQWQVASNAVVSSEISAADAVLREARIRNADLIVVGTRSRGWLRRLIGTAVADQIVTLSDCSVAIMPIGAHG